MLQLIPGDDQALRSCAGQLSAVASSIQTVIEHVGLAEQQVKSAGANMVTTKLSSALQKDQTLLGNACSALQQAAQCLNTLAGELEQIDAEAVQQRRQVAASAGHALLELTYLEPYLVRADSARTTAANQLTRLTNQAPGLPKSPHHGFLRDVWDGSIGGLLSGLWGVGKGAWDLTGEGLFNEKKWAKSWSDTARDTEQIVEHPGAFGNAAWDAISESDLRHQDPAAWGVAMAINVASLFVGAGEVNAALKTTRIGDALKVSGLAAGDTSAMLTAHEFSAALQGMSAAQRTTYFSNIIDHLSANVPKISEIKVDGAGIKFSANANFGFNAERLEHVTIGKPYADGGYGGGHLYPGFGSKPAFPSDWTPTKIVTNSYELLQDPATKWQLDPSRVDTYVALGKVDGVEMKVVVEPDGRGIVTSYPYIPGYKP